MGVIGDGGAGVMATTATSKKKANKGAVNRAGVSQGVPHKVAATAPVAANNVSLPKNGPTYLVRAIFRIRPVGIR